MSHAIEHLAQEQNHALNEKLHAFKDVLIQDSSIVILHESLSKKWHAARTRRVAAGVKVSLLVSAVADGPKRVALFAESGNELKTLNIGPWVRDDQVLQIIGAESDIADRIMSDPSVIEEGLQITDRGKQTRSGAINLYGIDRDRTPIIIEVKRSQPTPFAVFQLKAYVLDHLHTNPARVRGILCAPDHTSHDKS